MEPLKGCLMELQASFIGPSKASFEGTSAGEQPLNWSLAASRHETQQTIETTT